MLIHTPHGNVGLAAISLALSSPVLTGRRVAVLDNGKPHARLVLVRLAEKLAERGGAKLTLVTDKGPGCNAATPCSPAVLDRLVEEVDLVITGSAD